MDKHYMNSVEINYATAQIFLNILHGNKELKMYDNPVQKIADLCETTKEVLQKNNKGLTDEYGLPFDLPFDIFKKETETFSSLGQDIYSKTVEGSWMEKEVVLPPKKRKDMIVSILKRYAEKDKKREACVIKELEDPNTPSSFIVELFEIKDNTSLKKRIDEWSSYEIEDLFSKVGGNLKPSTTHDKKENPPKKIDTVLDNFIKTQYQPTDKGKVKKIRDAYAESILFNLGDVFDTYESRGDTFTLNTYFELKKIDNHYKGRFPPSLEYIRNIFLPWLLLKEGTMKDEEKIYANFNKDYKKVSKT